MYSLDIYKKLHLKKMRTETGLFLVEGKRAVSQICDFFPGAVEEIACYENFVSRFKEFNVKIVTESQFKKFSSLKSLSGIAALVKIPEQTFSDSLPENTGTRLLFLDGVQDPGNVGTLIRTAAAFEFNGVILSDQCADPFSLKVIQSTAGSVLSLWIRKTDKYLQMILSLKKMGFSLVCADLKGSKSPSEIHESEPVILGLGSEGHGISDDIRNFADFTVKININRSNAESLNVAVSGGILMYFLSQNK